MKSLSQFANDLRQLPKVIAIKVAEAAAPALNAEAKRTFDAGQTPYGLNWVPSVEGQRITLRKSGDLEAHVRYVAVGTRLRAQLGVAYAKYQVGKRPVLPRAGVALPATYSRVLEQIAVRVAKEELGR